MFFYIGLYLKGQWTAFPIHKIVISRKRTKFNLFNRTKCCGLG